MNPDITEIVRKGYTHENVVEGYARAEGVWLEEKEIFDKYFKNVGRILDIGCGGGRTSFYLASIGNKVTAIDLSPQLIEAAQEKLAKNPADIEFMVKDAQHLDYPDNHFDGAVFSFNGIGFIPRKENKLKLLKEIERILKPQKHFFFTAHNLWSINSYFPSNVWRVTKIFLSKIFRFNIPEKEYGEKYDENDTETPYIDIKSKKTWDKLVEQSGLEVELFSSKYAIRDKRKFSLFKDYFGASNYLFFVLKK